MGTSLDRTRGSMFVFYGLFHGQKHRNKKRFSMKGNVRHPAKLAFKKSMTWEEDVSAFIASRLQGYSLNIPCGSSKLGSVRLDIDPTVSPDKVADMNKLPFPDCVFDSAV